MTLVAKSKTRTKAPLQERHGPIVREHQSWVAGDVAHQGDLIFVCIGTMPTQAKVRTNRQLADGNTQGSRHELDGGKLFDCDTMQVAQAIHTATKGKVTVGTQYIGPVFAGPAFVRHPQHQDQGFPADTVTACIYQRNADAEGRERRALD